MMKGLLVVFTWMKYSIFGAAVPILATEVLLVGLVVVAILPPMTTAGGLQVKNV